MAVRFSPFVAKGSAGTSAFPRRASLEPAPRNTDSCVPESNPAYAGPMGNDVKVFLFEIDADHRSAIPVSPRVRGFYLYE